MLKGELVDTLDLNPRPLGRTGSSPVFSNKTHNIHCGFFVKLGLRIHGRLLCNWIMNSPNNVFAQANQERL